MADGKCVALFEPTRALGLDASDPAVSPDGQWIAMAWGVPTMSNLAVLALRDLLANTPRPRIVVPEEKRPFEATYLGAANPAWSPDGRMLAFSRTVMVRHFVSGNLCVVNADGSGLRQLTRAGPDQFCAQPCFSPDGRRIVFAILTGRQGPLAIEQLLLLQFSADLYVVNLDGSGLTRLTSDGVSCEPAWGP
jgi:Tol biopolymer transport system component